MFEDAYSFLLAAGSPRICVIGDVMLDRYVWGNVSRISQEGPIPVMRVERVESRPGGAGNVAAMLAGLGARVSAVGLVGTDEAAESIRNGLEQAGVNVSGIIRSAERPTATKTRYLGYVQSAGRALQQILRVDEEVADPLPADQAGLVREAAEAALQGARLVVVQDMGKGLLAPSLIVEVVRLARAAGAPVVIDPELTDDYSPYAGASCLVPNRFEAQRATGLALGDEEEYEGAARLLLERLGLEAIVIKLDRDGIYFATSDGQRRHMPTLAREVADITGAGDMVTAAFSFARADGADYATAVALANFAAAMEVGLHGVTPIPRRQLLDAMRAELDPGSRKLVPRERVAELAGELRAAGKKVAFTNGCFDLLHLGHVELLRYARAQADVLIVGLNSDVSVRKLKGPDRPVNSEDVRSRILASMADVDYVVLFDEASVLPLVRQVRPDVLVKGGDYSVEEVVGHEFVLSYGGQVKLAPRLEGFSTTDLIRRIAGNHAGTDTGNPR